MLFYHQALVDYPDEDSDDDEDEDHEEELEEEDDLDDGLVTKKPRFWRTQRKNTSAAPDLPFYNF